PALLLNSVLASMRNRNRPCLAVSRNKSFSRSWRSVPSTPSSAIEPVSAPCFELSLEPRLGSWSGGTATGMPPGSCMGTVPGGYWFGYCGYCPGYVCEYPTSDAIRRAISAKLARLQVRSKATVTPLSGLRCLSGDALAAEFVASTELVLGGAEGHTRRRAIPVVRSGVWSTAGSFGGDNSPAALCKRRSQVSHAPSLHCDFGQSNSQSAMSAGTSSTTCRHSHAQTERTRFIFPPRVTCLCAF